MLRKLVFAAAAILALAGGVPSAAGAATLPRAQVASPRALARPAPAGAVRRVSVLLADAGADGTSGLTDIIEKLVSAFTGGVARALVVLALVASCITILQRPDAHELIGAMAKVVLIGVVVISAQTIVNYVYAGF